MLNFAIGSLRIQSWLNIFQSCQINDQSNNLENFIVQVSFRDVFFSISVFFHRHRRYTGQKGKGGIIFYSTLPLPPAQENWDIYLQLCMWDDYHVFLIATFVFTRLLLDEIYHLIEIPFWLIDWWCYVFFFTWWIHSRFFVTAIWHENPVDLNLHRLPPLYYKRTD